MKKKLSIILALVLSLALVVTGCGAKEETKKEDDKKIVVGATPLPHAQLLELVKEDLSQKGYELEIVEFTDYVKPNLSLNDKELDANFFQHLPYLESFNKEHGLDLASIANIHVEPMGLFSKKIEKIEDLADSSLISIPNDSVNGARALILLEANGLIKLDPEAGLAATERDIIENPKNLKFKALEAAQLTRTLQDVDASIINGNFAIEAGLNPVEDSLLIEGKESPYANIVTVRSEDAENPKLKALVEALQSEKVKEFIAKEYGGAVVPAF